MVDATSESSLTGETLWLLADHLGSIRDVVDNNGVTRQHVVYDSFGNRILEQDYDASGNAIASSHADAIDTLFGYTDVELQYNRARWYDPATGRWLSQDPIGFQAGDANLYRYVGNGAVDSVDPSGLQEPAEIPLQPPPGGWPSRGPQVQFVGRPLSAEELLSTLRTAPSVPSSHIGPYSKPLWMTHNDYALKYIDLYREGMHTRIASRLYWMLAENPPYLAPGMPGYGASEMELCEASNVLAEIYIDSVVAFLEIHQGARPAQGTRNWILNSIGISNKYNHPWCDDWATFIYDYLLKASQEATITVQGRSTPVWNIFWISRYHWAEGYSEHNYVGVKPRGYELNDPIADDPVLLLFDPWWHLWPEVFTTGSEPLPPTGRGIRD